MRGVWWVLYGCVVSLVSAYRFLIVPGLGGSILYNQKSQKIWPPEMGFQLADLSVQQCYHRHDLSSTGEIGSVDSIRIDNRAVYMLTKNTYYTKMINVLSRQNDVSALPYDFRFIHYPEYHELLFAEYKKYIEKEYETTREKFVIVAHSMGGLLVHHFLQFYADKRWTSKHVDKVYYINTPFGGCPTALFFLLDSINKHVHSQNRDQLLFNNHVLWIMMNIQNIHLFGGLYVCLPITKDPLMRIHRNWVYSKDIQGLFQDDWSAHTYRLSRTLFRKRTKTADVPQTVVYSTGKNTTVFMDYDTDTVILGDGDGLVPVDSLLYPQCWNKPPAFVHVPDQDHSNINNHMPLLEMIADNRDTLEKNSRLHKPNWWFF